MFYGNTAVLYNTRSDLMVNLYPKPIIMFTAYNIINVIYIRNVFNEYIVVFKKKPEDLFIQLQQ